MTHVTPALIISPFFYLKSTNFVRNPSAVVMLISEVQYSFAHI